MSGHAHGSPEKIMAAERPCPAGPRTQASRLNLGEKPKGKAVASFSSSRTQLSELAGLRGRQHGERNVAGRERHPGGRLPGLVPLSSPRHAALILSSLQPPSPVAAAVDSLAGEHLPPSDTPERLIWPLPAHTCNRKVRVDEREQLLSTPDPMRKSSPPSSVSPSEVCGAASSHPACLQSGLSDQEDHRRLQNTPTTKAPGGPQTPSLTPTTSCSISEASAPDESSKFAHSTADFTPRRSCELDDEHLAEHRRDDLQALASKVRLPAESGRIGMDATEESITTFTKPVQVLHELEALDTVKSTALLMQDMVELVSKLNKRRALDCWSQIWTNKRKREAEVAEYRAHVLSSRQNKQLAFITWSRICGQQSKESQKNRGREAGRTTKERILCQIWFSYARRRAALVTVITPVLDMQKGVFGRSTKRLAFEIWNRHTSVMIWTHGCLRLAAHKSRVITLRGILKRLRQFVAKKQARCSVAAQFDRRARRALMRRIWMAVVAHIIEQQMQAVIDSPSQSPQFILSATSSSTQGSPPACRKSLFGNAPSHNSAEDGGSSDAATKGDGCGEVCDLEALFHRQLDLTQQQALLITRLRERIDSQEVEFHHEMSKAQAEMSRTRLQAQSDAQALKRLQKKILEDSIALRQQKRRERLLICHITELRDHGHVTNQEAGQSGTVGSLRLAAPKSSMSAGVLNHADKISEAGSSASGAAFRGSGAAW